jgi:DNA gyrase/topoisomerase IV subunit A
MADETILLPPPVAPIKLKDALEEHYLACALSTITARVVGDVIGTCHPHGGQPFYGAV